MTKVTFDSVTKEYDDSIVAVDDFSFGINDGEFVSIVGPSGSGKSTLMRMVAGLEDITDGTIQIGDRTVNDVAPKDRGVAMVFQNYALYPHMSVRKNMSYGLKLTSDLSEDEIRERVREAAEMMGIEDLLDQRPGNLSGGQQQRVATGRAIVREPNVFLMDEPLSNLDAKLKLHMRTELQRIQEELKTTTIYVTHDQEEAMTMSDRIVVLDGGELQQAGTPEEIYHEPQNRFVANFIGSPSMNFFEVTIEDETAKADTFSYELSDAVIDRATTDLYGRDVTLGIRPEHIQLGVDGGIEAVVDVVEPVGSDNYVYLHVGEEECTVRTSESTRPAEESTATIGFDPEDIHLFDAKSKEALLEPAPREGNQVEA